MTSPIDETTNKVVGLDDEELFECVCGGFHYFKVYRSEWNGEFEYWLAFVEQPKTLRQRLHALKSVFTGETIYHGDIHGVDVKRLIEVLTPPKPNNLKEQ